MSSSIICTDDQPYSRLTADVFMIVTAFDDEDEIIEFIHKLEDSVSIFADINMSTDNFFILVTQKQNIEAIKSVYIKFKEFRILNIVLFLELL
mgnify:CR=1 FL=1